MGGYKHTGVANGSALTDYAALGQVQAGAFSWLSSVTGADTITAGVSPTPSAYAAGQTFRFVSVGANTGAVTLNISSLGAKSITKNGATALVAGDIPSGAVVTVVYDGTQFQLQNVSVTNSLTGYAKLAVAQSWTATQTPFRATATATAGAAYTWTLTAGQVLELTFGAGNITTLSVSGGVAGTFYTLKLTQDGTGSRLISAYTGFKFPSGTTPTLSTGASAIDVFTFYYDGTSMLLIGSAIGLA
jgi:hypothetical protein